MTEAEARDWVRARFGAPREALLARFEDLLREESRQQNLISAASFDQLWARHFVDSAQLVELAGQAGPGPWLDVGTGAGMPGLVVAALIERPVVLVEPRAKRAAFLARSAAALGMAESVTVEARRIENVRLSQPAAIVSARAVADLSKLLSSTHQCTDSSTLWLLPKGRSAQSEVEAARHNWQGVFHVKPSVTSAESGIVVARGVRPG